MTDAFPFAAIVGQDNRKMAMVHTAGEPKVGGVVVFGDGGTGKSTGVCTLAAGVPEITASKGCSISAEAKKAGPAWAE